MTDKVIVLFNAPQPRSRLYTTLGTYRTTAMAALLDWGYDTDDTVTLEQELSARHNDCAAIAMPMARVGINLVLRNLIRPGQKVILSPYTISDVVNMVLCAGGIPVFADIEKGGSCNIDANRVEELIETQDDIGAVLVTHFYGLICNIDPILEVCGKRGIPVVEDAAQSFGARLGERAAGTMGRAGIFSFGLLKNITSFVGGAVVTQDKKLERALRAKLAAMSVFPRGALLKKMVKGAIFDLATNPVLFDTAVFWLFRAASARNIKFFNNRLDTDSNPSAYNRLPDAYAHRLSGVQADVIRSQFDRYEAQTQERIAKAKLYYDGLKDFPGIELPPVRTDGSHIYSYYSILSPERDRVAQWMTHCYRDVQISHHRNCANMPCFAPYARECPNAERAAQSVIYLPTYPGYRESEIEKNIDAISKFFRAANQ